MSFFFYDADKKKGSRQKLIPVDTLQEMGCKACPLDTAKGLIHPKMVPIGNPKATFYLLGGSPDAAADELGEPFAGEAGDFLKQRLPKKMGKLACWDNSIRCHPPSSRMPSTAEVHCCSKYVASDIEKRKPWAVVGFGNTALSKFTGEGGITAWRGKRFPIRVGSHTCWYYPVMDPKTLLATARRNDDGVLIEGPQEKLFQLDLKRIYNDWKKEHRDKKLAPYVAADRDELFEGVQVLEDYTERGFRKLCRWLDSMEKEPHVGLDYETQNLRPYLDDSRLLTAAISNGEVSYAFPLDHPEAWRGSLRKKALARFGEFLKRSNHKITHNLMMEAEWSGYYYGADMLRQTEWDDTMSQAYILDQRNKQKGSTLLDLDSVVFRCIGVWIKDLFSGLDKTNMVSEPLDKVLPYNAVDAKYTYYAFFDQQATLEKEENESLLQFSYPHHIARSLTLTKVQLEGIVSDDKALKRIGRQLDMGLKQVNSKLHKLPEVREFRKKTGKARFNFDAPEDVAFVLHDILGRKEVIVREQGKDPKITTDEKALTKIPKGITKVPELVIEGRSLRDRRSRVVEGTRRFTMPDGKVHPNYNDKFVSTGRLSSEDPNLQNYNKHKHGSVRCVFKAPPGYVLALADYGAIEFRCIGLESQDETIIKSLWEGFDVHQHWADRFLEEDDSFYERVATEYGIDPDDEKRVIKQCRQESKNCWVFPSFFGASPSSCARYLKTSEDITYPMQEELWKMHGGVKEWQRRLQREYNRYGYVQNLLGVRRYGPLSYNEIINAPIQSLAAYITIDAMVRIDDLTDYKQILNNHDEIGFYLEEETYRDDCEEIAEIMVFPDFDFINIPMLAEITAGPNWYKQELVGEFSSDEYE